MKKLHSMKLTKKESTGSNRVAVGIDEELYPYGLVLHLNDEEIKKIDVDIKSLKVGDQVVVEARALVSSLSSRLVQEGKKKPGSDEDLSIQITDLALSLEDEKDFFAGFNEGGKGGKSRK